MRPDLYKAAHSRRSVLLANPGKQHSFEAALALQEAGLLCRQMTGVYYKPQGPLARAMRILPGGARAALEREFLRRFQPGLAPENVCTHPALELLFVASNRIRPLQRFSDALLRSRNYRFDRWVAGQLERHSAAAVVCYDTCARQTFKRAKALGMLCVLDQSIAHVSAGMKISSEERERYPKFADSWEARGANGLAEECSEEPLLADHVLAASDYVRQSLINIGVEPARIALMPYGVDIERFQPGERRNEKVFRVLFVGQLSQRKGIRYLLEAFKQLRLPGSELLLVGGVVGSSKGLREYREVFTHVSGVPQHEVQSYFQRADIFVYPSLHEGSALATYEALASGLPVIATPNCGSVVRDGIEGFIVPIRDVEALKEKILLLYQDRQLREEMGRRARQRAEEFTWSAYQRRVAKLFHALLGGTHSVPECAHAWTPGASPSSRSVTSPAEKEHHVDC
ncbi:MAG: glycosyltransferase family 4 protein [Acidipila sp.]|nr:glycosyltransferase family 4 protein [Acidipila sp.]